MSGSRHFMTRLDSPASQISIKNKTDLGGRGRSVAPHDKSEPRPGMSHRPRLDSRGWGELDAVITEVPQADLDLADWPVTCPAQTLAAQSSSCLGILDSGLVLSQQRAYRPRSESDASVRCRPRIRSKKRQQQK